MPPVFKQEASLWSGHTSGMTRLASLICLFSLSGFSRHDFGRFYGRGVHYTVMLANHAGHFKLVADGLFLPRKGDLLLFHHLLANTNDLRLLAVTDGVLEQLLLDLPQALVVGCPAWLSSPSSAVAYVAHLVETDRLGLILELNRSSLERTAAPLR